jgi:hypothetical protein
MSKTKNRPKNKWVTKVIHYALPVSCLTSGDKGPIGYIGIKETNTKLSETRSKTKCKRKQMNNQNNNKNTDLESCCNGFRQCT